MKTWEMIKVSVQGDTWYSETFGYPVIHTIKGLVSKDTGFSIRVSQKFLRVSDWKKLDQN